MKFILNATKGTAINVAHIQTIYLAKPLGEDTSWRVQCHVTSGAGPFVLRTGSKVECQKFFKSVIEDFLMNIEEAE